MQERYPRPHDADAAADWPAPASSGGASEGASEDHVRIGHVIFDGQDPGNNSCGIVAAARHTERLRRDVYVEIRDQEQGLSFLGQIIEGPFHRASEASEETVAQRTPHKARPDHEGYEVQGRIEILGRLVDGERIAPTHTRPRPGAVVYVFPASRLARFLGIEGDLYLGRLAGHDDVSVGAYSDDKNFLPRNVGIFGTVGSGKSNTAQVLVEETIAAGWAVVLIDVEGEYVRLNEPTGDTVLAEVLARRYGRTPQGMEDFHVYVPSSGNTGAAAPKRFKIPISALDPEVVADILEFSDGERRVFDMATGQAAVLHAPSSSPGAVTGMSADLTGRPYDLQHLVDGLIEGPAVGGNPTFRLLPLAKSLDVATASVLRSKLLHLGRSQMLDWKKTADVPELDVGEMLVGGRLSVLDISETDDRSRNLAIAYVLQALFEQVIATPRGEEMPSGRPRPPLLVVVEEVHTFVSRRTAQKMRAVLDNLQVITRRGRKRWMALALVSQQPNHVPDEIFELANTRFIHQIKSETNIEPVRQTSGNVDEALWQSVPTMGPGRCLLTSPVFANPMFVDVRPAQSQRLLTT